MKSCLYCWLLKVKLKPPLYSQTWKRFGLKLILDIVCCVFHHIYVTGMKPYTFSPCYIVECSIMFWGKQGEDVFHFLFHECVSLSIINNNISLNFVV